MVKILVLIAAVIIALTIYTFVNNEKIDNNNFIIDTEKKSSKSEYIAMKKSVISESVDNKSRQLTVEGKNKNISNSDELANNEIEIIARHLNKKWQTPSIEEPNDRENEEHGLNRLKALSDNELDELENSMNIDLINKDKITKNYSIDAD